MNDFLLKIELCDVSMPLNYARLKDSDDLAKQLLFWEVDMPSAACLKQKLVRWKLFWNEGRREDKPEDLMDALPYADEDIFPNIRQLILIGCTTPIGTCQAERSFSVLRRIKSHLPQCKKLDIRYGIFFAYI